MKFRYAAYDVSVGAGIEAVVYRPVVPITFRGPRGSIGRLALVDTGSDYSLAPAWIADVIGIQLPTKPTGLVAGVEGSPIETKDAEVGLEIRKGKQLVRVAARVHFAAQDYVLLGAEGFLEYFIATFDLLSRTIELSPNARLRANQ